jgi:hypothetical protein
MSDDVEKLLKPVINACYPGTFTAVILAVLQVTGRENQTLRIALSIDAFLLILSTIFVFFYTLYPWRKKLWTCTAITFILGLLGSLISILLIMLI